MIYCLAAVPCKAGPGTAPWRHPCRAGTVRLPRPYARRRPPDAPSVFARCGLASRAAQRAGNPLGGAAVVATTADVAVADVAVAVGRLRFWTPCGRRRVWYTVPDPCRDLGSAGSRIRHGLHRTPAAACRPPTRRDPAGVHRVLSAAPVTALHRPGKPYDKRRQLQFRRERGGGGSTHAAGMRWRGRGREHGRPGCPRRRFYSRRDRHPRLRFPCLETRGCAGRNGQIRT